MIRQWSRWAAAFVVVIAPVLAGAGGQGCSGPVPTGGTGGTPGAQCKSDLDCPHLAICKLCADGSCANDNVHCVNGACTPPNYTCPTPGGTPCRSSQECPTGQYCTVEDGACNPPPGCSPSSGACPAICYGVCAIRSNPCAGKKCGDTCAGLYGSALPTYCDASGQCRPMPSPPLCGGTCTSEEQALKAFVDANKACKTTADCQVLDAGCAISFDDGCTGGVYVNMSVDPAKFSALSQAFTACKGTSCVLCDRVTLPPACIAGLCQRQGP